MRNKIGTFILGTVLAGCTYNSYEVGEGEGSIQPINSCETLMDKYFGCGLNEPDSDYNYMVDKCKKKGWLNTEWKACFEANSCEDLAAGICDQFANL